MGSLSQRLLCARFILMGGLTCGYLAAQQPPEAPVPFPEETETNPSAPCLQPPEMLKWQDYNGPFHKIVGTFARKIERKAVHEVRYKPGVMLCSLEPRAKFQLFVRDTLEPISFLSVGFNAGIGQAQDSDPSFGQGGLGYAQRYGAELADQTTSRFFSSFVYPSLFSEDPRYYRLGQGSAKRRLLHAIGHTVIAHKDNGKRMFNFAEWLGTSTAVAIGYTYHPNNPPGAAPAARNLAVFVLTDMGFDVLREFWPEIATRFHMPFRGARESAK